MSRRFLLILGCVLFFLFVFFSYLVSFGIFKNIDFNITVMLQKYIPRSFDELFSVFSLVGGFEIASVFLLILLIAMRNMRGIYVLVFFALIHVVELGGKIFLYHPGPPHKFLRTDLSLLIPSWHGEPGSSYPSGHSGRVMFLSIFILFLVYKSKRISIPQKMFVVLLLAIYDGIMLISRIYLGEHWTTDVIGGILLGAALSCFGYLTYEL